jgi:3',5'-cyclic AMP phosphodiesterase CpdA
VNHSLRFRPDGTFTIVQFTDLHWKNGDEKDRRTGKLMESVLAQEQPDLIVLTGDVVDGAHCTDARSSYRQAVAAAERSGIPWAAVFGNHDDEGDASREQLMDVQLEHAGTIAEAGPVSLAGVGNFVVRVESVHDGARALYFLDSGTYTQLPEVPGYDWLRPTQIEWYREQARLLQESNGGKPVPSLVFQHIPLPEYRDVWNTQPCDGRRYEKVQAPLLNTGMLAAMVETGGVQGVFCGHDHINDYTGNLYGIQLCYGRATGYNTYGRWRFPRGARIIRLREGKPGFETWIRLAGGKKIESPRRHSPHRFSQA